MPAVVASIIVYMLGGIRSPSSNKYNNVCERTLRTPTNEHPYAYLTKQNVAVIKVISLYTYRGIFTQIIGS